MARPSKHDGVLYKRDGTQFWWMRYRDKTGERCQEPTGTSDWHEAQRKLRERLQARDDNILEIVRKGEQLSFQEWVESVPNILESHHVTGSHTLLLKVKTESTRTLEKLISRIRSLDGVESTETMVVLSSHIERVQLPLENRAETAQPRRNAKKRRAA